MRLGGVARVQSVAFDFGQNFDCVFVGIRFRAGFVRRKQISLRFLERLGAGFVATYQISRNFR